MWMSVNKELLKGSTATLVMQLLSRKKMYGYELIKELELLSGGLFELREGTLYPILHALENDKLVTSEWVGEEGGRQRKYYYITKTGRAHLSEKKKEWAQFRSAVDQIIFSKGELT
jgi:DNA-binding PadR family transcriptional regulator